MKTMSQRDLQIKTLKTTLHMAGINFSHKDLVKIIDKLPSEDKLRKRAERAAKIHKARVERANRKQANKNADYARYLEKRAYNRKHHIAPEGVIMTKSGERIGYEKV